MVGAWGGWETPWCRLQPGCLLGRLPMGQLRAGAGAAGKGRGAEGGCRWGLVAISKAAASKGSAPCLRLPIALALAATNNQSAERCAVRMALSPPLWRQTPMRTRQPHFAAAGPRAGAKGLGACGLRGGGGGWGGRSTCIVHKVQLQVASAVAASGASAAASLVLAASILLLLAPGARPCWCCCCTGA